MSTPAGAYGELLGQIQAGMTRFVNEVAEGFRRGLAAEFRLLGGDPPQEVPNLLADWPPKDDVEDAVPVDCPGPVESPRAPSTLGEAMRLIGRFTESEGGDSPSTSNARRGLFAGYNAWVDAGRPETTGSPITPRPHLHERWPDIAPGLLDALAWLADEYGQVGVVQTVITTLWGDDTPLFVAETSWEAQGRPTYPGRGVVALPDAWFQAPLDEPLADIDPEPKPETLEDLVAQVLERSDLTDASAEAITAAETIGSIESTLGLDRNELARAATEGRVQVTPRSDLAAQPPSGEWSPGTWGAWVFGGARGPDGQRFRDLPPAQQVAIEATLRARTEETAGSVLGEQIR